VPFNETPPRYPTVMRAPERLDPLDPERDIRVVVTDT
jgi:hypothetical protein